MKTIKAVAKNIDEYLDELTDKKVRMMLKNLRKTIRSVAPHADEVISYSMPGFNYHGPLVYFAAFKNHCSFFPGNSSLIAKMETELKPYRTSKGTIQFTVDDPLPASLVKKIVTGRIKENLEKEKKKKLIRSTKKKK